MIFNESGSLSYSPLQNNFQTGTDCAHYLRFRAFMDNNSKKKYLILISIHGLIRSHDLEFGRDADTGGQIKYVVDLARALAEQDDVEKVDLITRRIVDVSVSDDYAVPVEAISDKARIIRIDAGPEEYIPKEQLWDHLDSFMDNLTNWLNKSDTVA